MAADIRHVAIIGGGFSGAMLAARLAEAGVRSSLIDRSGTFGPGLAYSTPFEGHLLNVRADRMSAVEGRSSDFVDWLRLNCPQYADPDGFAPRRLYGEYLQHRLNDVRLAHPGMIELIKGEVEAIEADGVRLGDTRVIKADAVVLATGNPAPRVAGPRGDERSRRVLGDPWALAALERIGTDDEVIIVGSGLTMVDMALWLDANGRRGRIKVLSRRGLTPRAHGVRHDHARPPTGPMLTGRASARLAEARRLAADGDWRGVMEGLRPLTARLWSEADTQTRARWVRHLRPWWDVHRHRIPVGVAEAINRMKASGRLNILAGRVAGVEADGEGVTLNWHPRDGTAQQPITGQWLIDCTGPGHSPADDPVTGPLIKVGRARLDALGIGLDLDAQGRVLGSDSHLYALGPPARAAFWETTAVPDIRKRIEALVGVLRP